MVWGAETKCGGTGFFGVLLSKKDILIILFTMLYFVVNKYGGRGKSVGRWVVVQRELEARGEKYEVIFSEYHGHAKKIAAELTASGSEKKDIIIIGGDGTINEFLNGVVDFSVFRLGVIPAGSGNDFSRGLHLARHNPKKSIRSLLDNPKETVIDTGLVTVNPGAQDENQFRFCISAGLGLDALICQKNETSKIKTVLNKLHIGKLSYIAITLQTFFSMKSQTVKVSFDGEEERVFDRLIFLSAMNFSAEGGGVLMSPKARADDSVLSACAAGGVSNVMAFVKFPFVILGLHSKLRGFYFRDFKTMTATAENGVVVHTDGEVVGVIKSLKIECESAKLKIIS